MHPRYIRPEMAAIWNEKNKFQIFLNLEISVAQAQENFGLIPKGVAEALRERAHINPARIKELEQITRHETLAFLTHISEQLGDEARFLHHGMTSSDVLDTTLAIQLTQATDLLLADLDLLLSALKRRAFEHKQTLCIGRTHGIHAEPTTFGLKLLGHAAAFQRSKERLLTARKEIATCKLSGAVGTYAGLGTEIESYVAAQLGLIPEPVSTQVIPRDRHAAYFTTLAIIAGSIECLATEIRHLQRTEVREVEEYFAPGQKGSSAMPHKRNPILSENLCGLARLVRSAVTPALENIVLWHERDMSHSSVERVLAPDVTCTLDFALHRLAQVIDGLVVYPDRMKKNLNSQGGLHFSQNILLALTQNGLSREEAYAIVQGCSSHVWSNGGTLQEELSKHETVQKSLSPEQLAGLFDCNRYASHIDAIFEHAQS